MRICEAKNRNESVARRVCESEGTDCPHIT